MANASKKKSSGKYQIYDRRTKTFIVVSRDIYLAYYRETWRQRKEAQKLGKCLCRRNNLWMCDGNCLGCQFSSDGVMKQDDDDRGQISCQMQHREPQTPEEVYADAEVLDALLKRLVELDPQGERIFALFKKELSDTEIAGILHRPQSTFADQIKRYRKELKKLINEIA